MAICIKLYIDESGKMTVDVDPNSTDQPENGMEVQGLEEAMQAIQQVATEAMKGAGDEEAGESPDEVAAEGSGDDEQAAMDAGFSGKKMPAAGNMGMRGPGFIG